VNEAAPDGCVWLDVDEADVLMLDEGFVLADAGLFAAALLRPQTSIGGDDAYPTVFLKAAAMAESLARNHAFVDGNKRACWILTKLFLLVNGVHVRADTGSIVAFVADIVRGDLKVAQAALWLEQHST
jgi:death-on-curing protein